jgi:parallel beta-helix repeat protein
MKRVKEICITVFLLILAFNLMTAGNAAAAKISVNNSTGQAANFTSIQAAVNAASSGDEIVVMPGIYVENIKITKKLSIVSASGNPSDTKIQAANSSEDIFSIWVNGVNIRGFGITGSASAGIHLMGVADCQIRNNKLSYNNCGIDLYMLSSGNNLDSNKIWNSSTGISLGGSWFNTMSRNSISNCSNGILLFDSTNNMLNKNFVSRNKEGISLTGESNSNTLVNNTISFNEELGLRIYETSNNLIYNNHFNNTLNVKPELSSGANIWNTTKTEGTNIAGGPYLGGNLWTKPDGTMYPDGSRDTDLDGFLDAHYDIENSGLIDYLPLKALKPTTITVGNNTDQGADFTSIQAAIDSSSPGDIVLIQPGVYKENIDIYVTNLTLISESRNPSDTRIEAINNLDDIVYVIADGVSINGLNITGDVNSSNAGIRLNGVKYCNIENSKISGNNSSSNTGFGIFLDSSNNNNLNNNSLSNNTIGIYLENSSQNMLINSTLSNSLISGISLWNSTANTLNNFSVFNCNASIILQNSSENLLGNNNVSNNTVGIRLRTSSSNSLSNNTAFNNKYGISMSASSNNKLNNNSVSNNTLGIYLRNSSNNRLSDNWVNLNSRYGIYLNSSPGNVLNSNRIVSNLEYGLYLRNSQDNSIYNNYFNNTNNTYFRGINPGTSLNTIKTKGTNIIGGTYLAGNFWATLKGKGFSQTQADENKDGICDAAYTVSNESVDYLPLAG